MNLHPKVKATGIAGIIATAVVAIAAQYGVDLPPDAIVALVVSAVTFVAGYLKSSTPTPPPVVPPAVPPAA